MPLSTIFLTIAMACPVYWVVHYILARLDPVKMSTVKEDAKSATVWSIALGVIILCMLLSFNFIMEAPF